MKICLFVGAGLTACVIAAATDRPAAANAPFTCENASADKTVTLGTQAQSVSATSGTTYDHQGCDRFIADINVPAGANGVPHEDLASFTVFAYDPARGTNGGPINLSKAECPNYRQWDTFYKKAAGAPSFTVLGGGELRGHWNDSFPIGCYAERVGNYSAPSHFSPPQSGTDTYRVATRVDIAGAKGHVRAMANHDVALY